MFKTNTSHLLSDCQSWYKEDKEEWKKEKMRLENREHRKEDR
jgi:hypothetical protein